MNPSLSVQPLLKHSKKVLFWTCFFAIVGFLLLYRLNTWPSLWWDEGWTLDAARNWILHGHLGHYLDGIPITARSPVRFPVVIPIALSMKIFGVGIWQGRLPGVIFTLLSLVLVYFLSSRIYNRKVGMATLIILIFFSPFFFSTIATGRQVLAEMPMIFYLLAGYSTVWLALNRNSIWGIAAAIFFGISLHAKLQVPPFWLFSIAFGLLATIIYHQKKSTLILTGITIGSLLFAVVILIIQNIFMPGSLSDLALIDILFNTAVIVLSRQVRISALTIIGLYFFPQLIGYIWAIINFIKSSLISPRENRVNENEYTINKKIVTMLLWGLGFSWFLWFLLMAMSWTRYLFPPYFFGCIFFSAFFYEVSGGFNHRVIVKRITRIFLCREYKAINFQALLSIIVLSMIVTISVESNQIFLFKSDHDPIAASKYLSQHIPPGARVESFESELFFLSPNIKFHYPSDLVSMQYVRKYTVDPNILITYNLLEAKPDYIVLGPYAKNWQHPDENLFLNSFELENSIGGYDIYKNLSLQSIK
jgi:4-amino-4-deoxy-L-arabinose transferase-like glycosyltransferase